MSVKGLRGICTVRALSPLSRQMSIRKSSIAE
jgi:hypothetical protein